MRLLCYLTIPLLVFLPEVRTSEPSNAPLDVRMYFSEVDNDMTKVTWVHRCNSKVKLESALASKVMMIEADIIAGHLEGDGGGPPIPVMGHPPDTTGDLSLEQFLDMVLQHGSGKGIKLDFKSLAIFKASENVLEQFLAKAEVDFPVWINADILQGPGEPKREAVEPNYFLRTCVNKFPLASISAGWTVDVSSAKNLQYNSTHIDEMTSLLIENNVVHPVTFPVHAGIAANSLDALRSLVHSSVDGTSLTIWCGSGEWVDYNKLRQLISVIGRDKVFVDMPEDMMSKLLSPPPSPTPPSKATGISAALSSLTLLLTVLICVN